MAGLHKKKLLVEGDSDKRVIPVLIEANGISWGETKSEAVVYIESYGGVTQLLAPDVISTELKASRLSALGLIVDADEDPASRWQSIRNACLRSIRDLPENLPETGLIHNTSYGVKFGVWILPDNKISGMLETFLALMIPSQGESLWTYAQSVVQEAKHQGAPFKQEHTDKAHIHTWLAWQDPPGRQLHNAVIERIIDPNHPNAQTFVNWFKYLYDL
ncbi:MAG: hypothetical protein GDA56_18110 [Hormoscilla sp. GM7CHS1pb]|nr:hypothetical protein [Hormoscilla sp. GM7CHS1pb]